MKKYLLFNSLITTITTLLVLLTSNYAYAKNLTIQKESSFYAFSVDSAKNEARIFGIDFKFKVNYGISDNLTASLKAGVVLETGSQKSLNVDEFAPGYRIKLDEGYLRWQPLSQVELKFGGINQKEYGVPIFLDSVVFVGAKQKISVLKFDNFLDTYLSAQQAIPSNHALSTRLGAVIEGTPSLFIESLGINLKTRYLQLTTEGSYFYFSNLYGNVAKTSGFMGNSVTGTENDDTAKFLYNFQGIVLNAVATIYINDELNIDVHGSYLNNTEAPVNKAMGYIAGAGLVYNKIYSSFDIFYNEQDSSPAYYNSSKFGHNNREGISLILGHKWQNDLMDLSLQYVDSKVINISAHQSDAKIISLTFAKEF
ncbi:MAG: hypothetical protein ISR65_01010 [Bacteriovoracaceae bacterium]|nr:hypothetical protein [Bacteriovoracaceae bacterium]